MAGTPIRTSHMQQLEEYGEDNVFELYLEHGSVRKMLRAFWGLPKDKQPDVLAFNKWTKKTEERQARWEEIKKIRGMIEFDAVLEKSETTTVKNARARRIQIDAHKWRAERLNKPAYAPQHGAHVEINIGGEWLRSMREAAKEEIEEAEFKVIEETTDQSD